MHRKMINPFGGNGNEGWAERCGINASVVALNRKRLGVGRGWVIHGSDRGDLDCSGRGGADPFADAAAGAAFFVDFDFASIIDAQRLVTDGTLAHAGLAITLTVADFIRSLIDFGGAEADAVIHDSQAHVDVVE